MITALQVIEEYRKHLLKEGLSPATIERKSSSVRSYLEFIERRGLLEKSFLHPLTSFKHPLPSPKGLLGEQELQRRLANLGIKVQEARPSLLSQLLIVKFTHKLFRTLASVKTLKTKAKSWRYTIPYSLKYNQPQWLIRYKKLSFSRYLNLAVLIIICVGLGIGSFEQFGKKPSKEGKILGTAPVLPPKYLSFQGRLTDSAGTPITTASHFRFSVYNSSSATGSAKLYEEPKWILPDQDGIFNTLIGDSTTLDQTIFQNNTALWLGVTVGTNSEMTDRQQVATVAYAFNSQYLQGYGVGATDVGANVNEIPVIDYAGRLMIAAAGPTLQTTSGTFKVESPTLALMVAGNSGNVGIGISNPGSKLSVSGGVGIGTSSISSAYLSTKAPDGGLIVEGNVGLGTTSPTSGYKLDVIGNLRTSGNINVGGSASITGIVNLANLTASRPVKTNAAKDLISSLIDLSSTNDITGVLGLANGGTNRNMSASNGAVVYSDADSFELTGVGNSGQVLMSNGAAAPVWVSNSGFEVPLTFSNGLTRNTNDIHWGGTLEENTLITFGNFNTRFNLSGTGDFLVEDAGVPALTVTDSGNVGIGTSNPVGGVLHVEGQCVTGDSLLPVLRIDNRNSKIENQTSTFQPQDQASSFYSQPSTELIPIKDIKGGEYVLSLDEETDKIVPARIKGLLDMGVKPVFKLTTEDGRTIRTTGNHPYLVRNLFPASPNQNSSDSNKNQSYNSKINISASSHIISLLPQKEEPNNNQDDTTDNGSEKIGVDNIPFNHLLTPLASNIETAENAKANINDTPKVKKNLDKFSGFTNKGEITPAENQATATLPAISDALPSWPTDNLPIKNNYNTINKENVNPFDKLRIDAEQRRSIKWTKVIYLKIGDEIAVVDSSLPADATHQALQAGEVKFVKIKSIEELPAEQVYDIEVEGTHNFVGGHYINKKTGKALTEQEEAIYRIWKNSKFEALNPKQFSNFKAQNSKLFENLDLENSNLFSISDLEIRISDEVGFGGNYCSQYIYKWQRRHRDDRAC